MSGPIAPSRAVAAAVINELVDQSATVDALATHVDDLATGMSVKGAGEFQLQRPLDELYRAAADAYELALAVQPRVDRANEVLGPLGAKFDSVLEPAAKLRDALRGLTLLEAQLGERIGTVGNGRVRAAPSGVRRGPFQPGWTRVDGTPTRSSLSSPSTSILGPGIPTAKVLRERVAALQLHGASARGGTRLEELESTVASKLDQNERGALAFLEKTEAARVEDSAALRAAGEILERWSATDGDRSSPRWAVTAGTALEILNGRLSATHRAPRFLSEQGLEAAARREAEYVDGVRSIVSRFDLPVTRPDDAHHLYSVSRTLLDPVAKAELHLLQSDAIARGTSGIVELLGEPATGAARARRVSTPQSARALVDELTSDRMQGALRRVDAKLEALARSRARFDELKGAETSGVAGAADDAAAAAVDVIEAASEANAAVRALWRAMPQVPADLRLQPLTLQIDGALDAAIRRYRPGTAQLAEERVVERMRRPGDSIDRTSLPPGHKPTAVNIGLSERAGDVARQVQADLDSGASLQHELLQQMVGKTGDFARYEPAPRAIIATAVRVLDEDAAAVGIHRPPTGSELQVLQDLRLARRTDALDAIRTATRRLDADKAERLSRSLHSVQRADDAALPAAIDRLHKDLRKVVGRDLGEDFGGQLRVQDVASQLERIDGRAQIQRELLTRSPLDAGSV